MLLVGVISRSFAGFMQWRTLAGTLLMLLWPVLENKIGQHTSTTERVQLESVLTWVVYNSLHKYLYYILSKYFSVSDWFKWTWWLIFLDQLVLKLIGSSTEKWSHDKSSHREINGGLSSGKNSGVAVQLFLGKKFNPPLDCIQTLETHLISAWQKQNIYIYILILRARVLHHGVLETFSIRKFKDFNSLLLKKRIHNIYLAIFEWHWLSEELWRLRRVLSSEAPKPN